LALQGGGFVLSENPRKSRREPLIDDPLAIKPMWAQVLGPCFAFLASGHKLKRLLKAFSGAGVLLGSSERTKIEPLSYFDILPSTLQL